MSNIDLIIEERARDIGDFLVGRILPFRKKRMVGPFAFIDHMGPMLLEAGKYLDVDQHPHIGISTLTYLLEGEITHKDSIGNEQIIKPGSVNWMTAGKGITHTERTPVHHRDDQQHAAHGFQIWVALPSDQEEIEPSFFHLPADQLPRWSQDGADFTLIAGEGFGRRSPLPVYSDLFMVEVKTDQDMHFDLSGQLSGEIGIYIIEGQVQACEHTVEKRHMLVSKIENSCQVQVTAGSHLMLFGGQPFEERRYMYWNFVSSSRERLEAAKQLWRDKGFPKVPGDDTYVEMP